jgi:hypothetical protein
MTITEGWTIAADFVTRMVALSIHTICLLLVGSLMGAWIVHLTESPEVQEQHSLVVELGKQVQEQRGFVVELGKRLNLCLVNRQDDRDVGAELAKLLDLCRAKAKAAGVNLSDMPSSPGSPGK